MTCEIASTLTEKTELEVVARLVQGGSCPKYATEGMSQITYLKIGGAITHQMCTMDPELLNSPGITKDIRTKPSIA